VRTFRRIGGVFMGRLAALSIVAVSVSPAVGESEGKGEDPWRVSDPVVQATNRGVVLMEQYDYAGAVEAFERALGLAPDSVEGRVNLAIALYNRAGKADLERGEKLLDEALQREADNARALHFRGITHQYSGRDEQALPCFQRVVELRPHDAAAWYLLARTKSHLGQPYRAELERAVKESPALASAHYDLMRLAWQEGKEEEAKAHRERFNRLRETTLSEMVVMPQYRRLGALAVVEPMPGGPVRNVAGGELAGGSPKVLLRGFLKGHQPVPESGIPAGFAAGLAMADVNGDGHLDIVVVLLTTEVGRGVVLLLGQADGTFADASERANLTVSGVPASCAFGDYDNDDKVDLFVSCTGANHLFRGLGDGRFEDVTARTSTGGPNLATVSAVFLDADHDADLDIYVSNSMRADTDTGPAPNQLLNNNGDGTFTDIAVSAGVACPETPSHAVAPADIDGDRDTDLVVFHARGPDSVFFNDRLGKYHEERITAEPALGPGGGVLQDFNNDGRPDLLISPTRGAKGRLYLSGETELLKPSPQFDGCLEALATWGETYETRVADVDLDGDLDVVVLGRAGHALLNDGRGHFVVKPNVWPEAITEGTVAVDVGDFTGDGVADLLRVTTDADGTLEVIPTKLTPPANWLAISPTGHRGEDKRTRSPASGFGTRVEVRCGVHSQVIMYTGLNGGLSQSQRPLVFGLNGVTKADYVAFTWPDGVTQCESELAAGARHSIREMERRVSSCPVLFAWDGRHFEFVGDFAGVGGLGYYVAPGEYAQPQVLEHVRLGPQQLAARDGFYELRLCEPMEEVAYVDRLELLAVDHPAELAVYPDERLAITGPRPTHRLLCPAEAVFPVRAYGPDGSDCVDELAAVDRVYAYQPELDRRFIGFCRPHSLVLDFADRLGDLPAGRKVYLFLTGSIEYPYSQTTYAAAQAGVTWEPMRIERRGAGGVWETIVPDAGAPGGIGRTITIDVTGKLAGGDCVLRITTNLEIYYDRVFIAADRGTDGFAIRTVPMASADLRRLGFPLEYSPDGRHPTIYTYGTIEPTSSFKMPGGAYTRYGRVEGLLSVFDDRYVILGTGDEIALRFDARALPPVAAGQARSFILVSHAYCKDMDLYTAEPDTVEPLPFAKMSSYPYPASERFPDDDGARESHRQFNTRLEP